MLHLPTYSPREFFLNSFLKAEIPSTHYSRLHRTWDLEADIKTTLEPDDRLQLHFIDPKVFILKYFYCLQKVMITMKVCCLYKVGYLFSSFASVSDKSVTLLSLTKKFRDQPFREFHWQKWCNGQY